MVSDPRRREFSTGPVENESSVFTKRPESMFSVRNWPKGFAQTGVEGESYAGRVLPPVKMACPSS